MSKFNRLQQRIFINILLLISVIIIIFLAFFSYKEINKLSEANKWVIHSHEVIEVASDVLIFINFAESRQRGYLITKDKEYLVLYEIALKNTKQNVMQLHYLTQDNKDQQELVSKLLSLVNARIDTLNHILNITEKAGLKAGAQLISSGQGKILSDQILQTCAAIIVNEKNILQKRNNLAFQHSLETVRYILIGNIFSLSLILFCVYTLNRQIKFRQQAENELRQSEKKLLHLAYYHTLTGLPNSLFLFDYIEKVLVKHHYDCHIAVLLLDLDNFKNINDSFGYETGDQLLKSFSTHLNTIARSDDLVAQLYADKFVIVLMNMDEHKHAATVAKKILASLAKPFTIADRNIFITVSIGISIYPQNGVDAKTLLKNADIAMHLAKEVGKNNFQYCTPEMTSKAEGAALLDYHLHHALRAEEMVLLYQPKFSLSTGKITGLETLIRWNRPNIGVVYPDVFIGLAESNGLIVPIGEWMIRTACRQGKKWMDEGIPPFTLAINLSTRQFNISNIVESIKQIIDETQFDPSYLEIEITESLLLENSMNNIASIHALNQMGIKITIDDFGTGYSSLNYIRSFTVDKLKIDKSFVQEIVFTDQTHSIINAIITMAHSLNIQVIAEGVETADQVALLKQFHCDEAQGYYFSHPLPAEEVKPLFLRSSS